MLACPYAAAHSGCSQRQLWHIDRPHCPQRLLRPGPLRRHFLLLANSGPYQLWLSPCAGGYDAGMAARGGGSGGTTEAMTGGLAAGGLAG